MCQNGVTFVFSDPSMHDKAVIGDQTTNYILTGATDKRLKNIFLLLLLNMEI